MTAISIDPRLWTRLHPLLIAHDVGGSRDRSTAVVGRSHLLEALHSNLQAGQVCLADGPEARHAYAQLEALEPEMREGGIVYKCLPGQHDDLGISCAMLNWAARHPHLEAWMGKMVAARRPKRRRQTYTWAAFT